MSLLNYPDLSNFPAINEGPSNGKPLWLGMLSPGRGAYELQQAIESIKDCQLDIIGPVSDVEWDSKQIDEKGNFSLHRAYEMATQYSLGLVTYLPEPNNVNSSPNKMYEYMALGIPIIASNFSAWVELVEDEKCGFCVDPTNVDDLKEKIERLLKDPELAKTLGLNGRRVVEQRFNWDQEKLKLISLYNRILGQPDDVAHPRLDETNKSE